MAAERVRELASVSGLTWVQIGLLFGVSGRAVHHWANGGHMTVRNAELLDEVLAEVSPLGSALLTSGPDGVSPYERLVARFRPDMPVIDGTYLPPEMLLGA